MGSTGRLFSILLLVLISVSVMGAAVSAEHLTLSASSYLSVQRSGADGPHAALISFDLSSIPDSVRIELAELEISVDVDTLLGSPVEVTVYAAMSSWTPSIIPTGDSIAITDTLLSAGLVASGQAQPMAVNVTDLMRMWVSGDLDNYGVYLAVAGNSERRGFSVSGEAGARQARLSIYYSK